MLNPDEYIPIDVSKVEKLWKKSFNVPNSTWEKTEPDIHSINNKELPLTLRVFLFNNLPYSIVEIIKEITEKKVIAVLCSKLDEFKIEMRLRNENGRFVNNRTYEIGTRVYWAIYEPTHCCSYTFDKMEETYMAYENKQYELIKSMLKPALKRQE